MNEKIIKIKISTPASNWPPLRQTPGQKGIWDNCQFYVNQEIPECDFWVVCENLDKKETVCCLKANTILVTTEPPSIKTYDKRFTDQFGTVITCHKDMVHPNKILRQQGMPWYVGVYYDVNERNFTKFSKDYDELKSISIKDMPKPKTLSIITSHKRGTPGHLKRMQFVEYLQKNFKGNFDVFGSGLNHIADKWDGLAPYKYCLSIENSSTPHYFTEKLSDAFLAGCYPFYFGCPNILEYFPEGSLTVIDVNKPEESLKIIEETIKNNAFEKSLSKREEAKSLVIDKYNQFPMLADVCTKMQAKNTSALSEISLRPEKRGNVVENILKNIIGKRNYYIISKNILSLIKKKTN